MSKPPRVSLVMGEGNEVYAEDLIVDSGLT